MSFWSVRSSLKPKPEYYFWLKCPSIHNRTKINEAVTGPGTASQPHTRTAIAFPNLGVSAKLTTRMSVRGMLERVNTGILAGGRHRTLFHWQRVQRGRGPTRDLQTYHEPQKDKRWRRGKKKWSEIKRQSECCCLRETTREVEEKEKGKREGQTKWGQERERGRRSGERKEGNSRDFQLRRVWFCGMLGRGLKLLSALR